MRLPLRRTFVFLAAASLTAGLVAEAPAAPAAAQPEAAATAPVRTYETERVNVAPAGCSAPAGRVAPIVSELRGRASARSIRVNDQSSSLQVVSACPVAARAGADWEFAVHPVAIANGYAMSLLGRFQGGGAAVPVFHLAAFADGALRWYDGTGWTPLTPGATIPRGQWSTVRVQVDPADQSVARIAVNGSAVGSARPAGPGSVLDVTGYQFASFGSAPYGDEVFFDDVAMVNDRGYETEAVGSVPAACTTPAGKQAATVDTGAAATGSRSLRLNDRSGSAQVVQACQISPQRGVDWEFRVNPATLRNGFAFSLLGHLEGIVADPRTVFHLAVYGDGSIRWFDVLDWTTLTRTGVVPTGRWSTIRVQVPSDLESARIFVDGQYVAAAGPVGVRAVTSLTGYQLSSFGTGTVDDDVFVDDLAVRPAVDGPLPGGTGGFGLAPYVAVEQAASGQVIQMPHASVAVPGTSEALVTYAPHADAAHSTGTVLRSSTDQGSSWNLVNQRNPFPDEQSFHLSRLRDGRLFAMNYHTFMVPNSGNTRASIDTAVSADGGRTWTRRTGVIPAPQAMRSINDTTSRPGQPLGGFVVVHNVVQDSAGALYVGAYGYYASDTKYRQLLLRSTDGGVNWSIRATVAVNPGLSASPRYEGFSEGAVEFVADGSMLMVMRSGSFQPMYLSRSTDLGATWSTPTVLRAGPDNLAVTGVYPTLLRTTDGRLLLYIGRPGQSILSSPDGSGRTWDAPVVVDYRNSGNGSLIQTGSGRLLVFGDRGPDWAAVRPLRPEIWSRATTYTP